MIWNVIFWFTVSWLSVWLLLFLWVAIQTERFVVIAFWVGLLGMAFAWGSA